MKKMYIVFEPKGNNYLIVYSPRLVEVYTTFDS